MTQDLFGNTLFQLLLIIFGAFVLQLIAHRYVAKLVEKVVKAHHYKTRQIERQREQTLDGILRTLSAVIIWLGTIILILSVLDINIGALLTGAGLIGVVVGFGAQNTIRDFIGGMFVIAENQYRIGDVITIADKNGVVEDITIRVTRLRDMDGNLHIVPNGHSETVTNMTFDFANINIDINVSYDADVEKVRHLIDDVGTELSKDKDWEEFIIDAPAFLRVEKFSDSAITVKVFGKVAPGKQWDVAGEFRERLKRAFEEKHIEIPYPQRVIHTKKD